MKFKFTASETPYMFNRKGGRLGVFGIPKEITDPVEKQKYVRKLNDNLMKETEIKFHPVIVVPTIANRVLERVNPGEFRRIELRDNQRRKDRAIVRDFCRKVLYIHEKHHP